MLCFYIVFNFKLLNNKESSINAPVWSYWPPRVADRVMLARYGEYRGNKIPGADQNQYHCLTVDRGICKG
jgi:hypothetical protein